MSDQAPVRIAPLPVAAAMRRSRFALVIALIVVLAAIIAAFLSTRKPDNPLDPTNPGPHGSMALAELLKQQGVQVLFVRTLGDAQASLGPDVTLFVGNPNLVPAEQVRELVSASGRAVLVEPVIPELLDTVAPGITTAGLRDTHAVEPACADADATAAGTVDSNGVDYTVATPTADACYARDGDAWLVRTGVPADRLTIVGGARAFTNERLDKQGNAALTMRLLGANPRLVWYLPSTADPSAIAEEPKSITSLLPSGWRWAALEVVFAVILLGLWRARRLGPVVSEPLPVAVKAAETTQGRAGLYRRIRAKDRAAEELRNAARTRLASRTGLGRNPSPDALVATVAHRSGRASAEVGDLLYGPGPRDEQNLVELADRLDALEREVRRP